MTGVNLLFFVCSLTNMRSSRIMDLNSMSLGRKLAASCSIDSNSSSSAGSTNLHRTE